MRHQLNRQRRTAAIKRPAWVCEVCFMHFHSFKEVRSAQKLANCPGRYHEREGVRELRNSILPTLDSRMEAAVR